MLYNMKIIHFFFKIYLYFCGTDQHRWDIDRISIFKFFLISTLPKKELTKIDTIIISIKVYLISSRNSWSRHFKSGNLYFWEPALHDCRNSPGLWFGFYLYTTFTTLNLLNEWRRMISKFITTRPGTYSFEKWT